MPDLFDGDSKHAPGARPAPETLNPAEWRRLREWAEERCPWISRGALGSLTPLEEHVDACLCHFGSSSKRRPRWLGTVQNWIRRDERARLERMARAGDESARLALRDPARWRDLYDAKQRIAAHDAVSSDLIRPAAGAKVVSLASRRSA